MAEAGWLAILAVPILLGLWIATWFPLAIVVAMLGFAIVLYRCARLIRSDLAAGLAYLAIVGVVGGTYVVGVWLPRTRFVSSSGHAAGGPSMAGSGTGGAEMVATITPRAPALVSPTAAEPAPSPPPFPTATLVWVVVANTDGEGVYVRRSPNLDDKDAAWPDGTRMQVIGQDIEGGGRRWKVVRDPAGAAGYVPAEYVTVASAS